MTMSDSTYPYTQHLLCRARKVSSLHLLSSKKVAAMTAVRQQEAQHFVNALEAKAEGGGLVEPRQHIARCVLCLMAPMLCINNKSSPMRGWIGIHQ